MPLHFLINSSWCTAGSAVQPSRAGVTGSSATGYTGSAAGSTSFLLRSSLLALLGLLKLDVGHTVV